MVTKPCVLQFKALRLYTMLGSYDSITEAVFTLWHWLMDSLCCSGKCRLLYDVLQQAQKWERWRTHKGGPCEIRLDEPQLQPCRLDLRAFGCCLCAANWSCVVCVIWYQRRAAILQAASFDSSPCQHTCWRLWILSSRLGWVKLNPELLCESMDLWAIFVLVH